LFFERYPARGSPNITIRGVFYWDLSAGILNEWVLEIDGELDSAYPTPFWPNYVPPVPSFLSQGNHFLRCDSGTCYLRMGVTIIFIAVLILRYLVPKMIFRGSDFLFFYRS